MVLIPAVFSPHSHTGPLLNRLMYGNDTEAHQTFKNRPNTNICEDAARSSRVPHDGKPRLVSITSSRIYGGSYKSMDPRTHFDQSLGLVMSTAIVSHLLRVHKQIRTTSTTRASLDDDTTSIVLAAATIFLLITAEEHPPPPPQIHTNDGTPDLSRRLSVTMFATLRVQHPTHDITTMKYSQWIPL